MPHEKQPQRDAGLANCHNTSCYLVAIQEEERRRLAIELHDRTSPNLSALGINLGLIVDTLPMQPDDTLARLIEDSYALLDDTIVSIRDISADFRPPLLHYAGFWPALEGYAHRFGRRTGIAVHAEGESDARLPAEIETHLFRIAQQALANCARHSLAQTVRIGYARIGDAIELTISDDGVGFDADGRRGAAADHGLAMMRYRAEFIGGKFSLETGPGQGTRIAVAIPAAQACGAPAA